jgi:maltose alpha-D-glucosyltransferase/alpha-amylase
LSDADEADVLAGYLPFAAAIGRRLGEMHALLSRESDNPDFDPEPAAEADARQWSEAAQKQIDAAFAVTEALAPNDEEGQQALTALRALRGQLAESLPALAATGIGTLRTRIHGDFHLGQVLATQGDAFIIDFEGEPAKPLAARRAKSSPLRDVAGLMRSFDYAAATIGRSATLGATGRAEERRAALLRRFVTDASASFLDAYRVVLLDAPRPWVLPENWHALLDLFLIEKAAYEICYEAANRPAWLPIPLRGMAELAARSVEGLSDAS